MKDRGSWEQDQSSQSLDLEPEPAARLDRIRERDILAPLDLLTVCFATLCLVPCA